MKKTLYSLMLNDEVVREVDALAHRMGTNRSALVNQILAEYVSVPTPERRWNDIFEAIEELMTPTRELVPFFAPGSSTMSLKSSLSYKYSPTVKYEVDLSRGETQTMGTLNIVFRTQSAELIAALTDFFRLWARIENACLAPALGGTIACSLYDGRFVRPLAMPRGHARSAEDIAGAISAYVQQLQESMGGDSGLTEQLAALKQSVSKLAAGSEALSQGVTAFGEGIGQLSQGTEALTKGTGMLVEAGDQLYDGFGELTDGTEELADGMKTYNEDGIQELGKLAGSDLKEVLTRMKALREADGQYDNYAGIADGSTGSVRFIIETEEIALP